MWPDHLKVAPFSTLSYAFFCFYSGCHRQPPAEDGRYRYFPWLVCLPINWMHRLIEKASGIDKLNRQWTNPLHKFPLLHVEPTNKNCVRECPASVDNPPSYGLCLYLFWLPLFH
jgi:hypothetical protein